MKVETEFLEDRQAKLVVTIDQERVDKAMKDAARRISRQVNIPGFRKGKAPYSIIVSHFGEGAVMEEALDPLGQDVYKAALEESELEPYAPGVLSDMQLEPMVMTFTVPLQPEVDLGDYRSIRIPYEPQAVTDDDVAEALDDIRDQHATLDPVERPIQMGDVAMLDLKGTLVRDETDEQSEESEERNSVWVNRADVRVKISEDSTYPVPGFPAKVIGLSAGDETSFDMSFPEDDEEIADTLRGKTLHFEVKCNEVYEFNPPELNDEFAKDHDFEDMASMEADIRAELEAAAQGATRSTYLDKVFDALRDGIVTVSYPPVMVEEQIDGMISDFDQTLHQRGINLEEYMRINNVDKEGIRDDFRESAEEQLVRALILGEVTDVEQLAVRDAEIDDEIDTAVLSYGENAGLMRQFLGGEVARRSLSNRLLAQKAVDRLIAIAKGEEPAIGEPELDSVSEEEEAPEAEVDPESIAPDMVAAGSVEEAADSVDEIEELADQEAAAVEQADSPSAESNEDHMESAGETE